MRLPSLQSVHVLVVGDVMLDRYWVGDARRVSQEAPVPVVDVTRTEDLPGGAANVALNVASLGARCTLIGLVGADAAADALVERLTAAGVTCDFVTVDDWPTIIKLRVVSRNQQLLRTDFERPLPAPRRAAVHAQVCARVAARLADASVVVLQDYDKGTIEGPEQLIGLARAKGRRVLVDPKHKSFARYAGADLVKPNAHEFRAAAGDWSDDEELIRLATGTCTANDFAALVITRGSRGMTVVERDGGHQHIPALPVDVYDVTGAGDTAIAALAVTRSLGWAPRACAQVANVASGIVVGKSGTAAVTGPELAIALNATDRIDRGVLERDQLLDAVAQARVAGERIVFTNGCFDILHAGHVAYLEEARALGDRLVVAVNDDESVRRLKGPGRPVNPLERRLRVLSGLKAVDWVVGFAEDTPEALLAAVRPDVLVKGGDYGADAVVGADLVRGYGGEVRVLGLVEDCSTTRIVERIQSGG
ncbi:MAG: bifunctional D-glycero-beta-D-manno-heptose-7-phosphate kinase/D-glycero-beta-D-manno-heptose 1-phosphate adenylyltransferase HldE [Pseudomonadales bacterium]|nr:bifunctional D-glycero-beta-D-manno-heptose-7-phosphate kinase/D-glycero-beta-D-manno-heptose 1-phosphate adenylyltransferase HldE [Pseudomonadales bacterium]